MAKRGSYGSSFVSATKDRIPTTQKGRVFYDANPFHLVHICSAACGTVALRLCGSRVAGSDAGSGFCRNRHAEPDRHANRTTYRRAGNVERNRISRNRCNA